MIFKAEKWIVGTGLILPVVAYFAYLCRYMVNIPFWDDYDAVFHFMNTWNAHQSVSLFEQHNEHRIVYNRLVMLSLHQLFGYLDLRWLILVANVSLCGVYLVMVLAVRRRGHSAFTLLPIPFLLFQVENYENAFWAMAGLANLSVTFFALAALYALSLQTRYRLWLAVLLAVAATFTNGNGLITFIVGTGMLWFGKRHRDLAIWLAFGLITITCYFTGYTKPSGTPGILSVLMQPWHLVCSGLVFLGSGVESLAIGAVILRGDVESVKIAVTAGVGALVVAWIGWLTVRGYYQTNPFVYWSLFFLLGTAGAAALARSGFGIPGMLDSRYKFTSFLVLTLVYVSLLDFPMINRRVWLPTLGVLLSGGLCILSLYARHTTVLAHQERLQLSFLGWQLQLNGLIYSDSVRANRIMEESIRTGLYRPAFLVSESQRKALRFEDVLLKRDKSLGFQVEQTASELLVSNQSVWLPDKEKLFFILQEDSSLRIQPARRTKSRLRHFLVTQQYYAKGFKLNIPHAAPAGGPALKALQVGSISNDGVVVGPLYELDKTQEVSE